MPQPRRGLLDPGTLPPAASEKTPSLPPPQPAAPLGAFPSQPAAAQPAAQPAAPGQTATADKAGGYGYDFEDDPLNAGGFGPDDATIRVRPGPVRTNLIRPRRQTRPELACSFDARRIAGYPGLPGTGDIAALARDIVTAFTGCEGAYVTIDAVPDPTGDDPRADAIERADRVRDQLIAAIGPGRYGEDRFQTGLSSGAPGEPNIEAWLGRRGTPQFGTGGPARGGGTVRAGGAPSGAREQTDQVSVQAGLGDVRHYYTSPHGANDALHEWLAQFVAAYTMQLHGKDKSGEERQIFAQVQYSLSTGQWTVSFGGQESYVIALPANLQLSFWAQLTAGENISARSEQKSLTAGTQLVWQPKDWLAVGAQAGLGPTVQSGGPSSIDCGALIFFQIQR